MCILVGRMLKFFWGYESATNTQAFLLMPGIKKQYIRQIPLKTGASSSFINYDVKVKGVVEVKQY